MTTNILLNQFNLERGLHKQTFDIRVASINILEELFEAQGLQRNVARAEARVIYNKMTLATAIIRQHDPENYIEPTEYDIIDAFSDIRVFAYGEHLKLGYNPEKVLVETATEILSRKGEIIDGKFTKFLDEESMKAWYKADYSGCRL